jgi:hypothetical protein
MQREVYTSDQHLGLTGRKMYARLSPGTDPLDGFFVVNDEHLWGLACIHMPVAR